MTGLGLGVGKGGREGGRKRKRKKEAEDGESERKKRRREEREEGGRDARCEEVWVFVTERGWRCKWCLLFVSPDALVWIIRFQG